MRESLVGLLAVMLVGCSGPVIDDPVEEVTPTASPEPEPEPTEVITVYPDGDASEAPDAGSAPSRRPRPTEVRSDPALVASLECEPVPTATLEQLGYLFGYSATDSVMVSVGEVDRIGGAEFRERITGEWWILGVRSPQAESDGPLFFETDHPADLEARGSWANLGHQVYSPEPTADDQVRRQSALEAAQACFEGSV